MTNIPYTIKHQKGTCVLCAIHTYVRTCMCICVACMRARAHVCVCVCVCTCVCVHVCVMYLFSLCEFDLNVCELSWHEHPREWIDLKVRNLEVASL